MMEASGKGTSIVLHQNRSERIFGIPPRARGLQKPKGEEVREGQVPKAGWGDKVISKTLWGGLLDAEIGTGMSGVQF